MTSYKDIKTRDYIDAMVPYVESLLGIQFKSSGENKYSSYCPFHHDTKDSFRVYVDKQDTVKFHCFGECGGHWDIYDIIMLREKCSFSQAVLIWAKHLGLKDVKYQRGSTQQIPDPDEIIEPADTVDFVEHDILDKEIVDKLTRGSHFYHVLLATGKDRFPKIHEYLEIRGIDRKHSISLKLDMHRHTRMKLLRAGL